MNRKSIILFLFLVVFRCFAFGQSKADSIILKAMNDELKRNMTRLTFDKYKPPFYIAYQIMDTRTTVIQSTLGSIIQSQENSGRTNNVRLMVGDYSLNDENFNGGSGDFSGTYLPIPAENDYEGIRRAFWSMSDQVYKSAVNNYEHKLTALKQQVNNNNERLDDYSRITPMKWIADCPKITIDKTKWEEMIKKLSSAFKPYKEILSSRVNFFYINSTIYYTTSEGTRLQYPARIAYLSVGAETQAEDGEPVSDFLTYYAQTPDGLPPVEKMAADIQNLIKNVQDLRKAPVIGDSYSGPVVFEGEAAAELFASLFSRDGLIASREPVSMFPGPSIGAGRFENKMNQRICPENISIFSTPKLKTFNNIPLVGSFDVDAEGVVPKDNLVLVDKGMLKTLLNDRIPTSKVKESNGNCRLDLFRGASDKAPGVINIRYDGGKPTKSMAKTAQKEARKNGLEYFYIIRKLDKNAEMPFSGGNMSVSRPIAIYKVSVKTGMEQLVRSAFISEFEISDFKKIIGGAKEQFIYNTIYTDGAGGYPATFIVPQSVVFSDINIEKDKGTRPQKPIVPNPAGGL